MKILCRQVFYSVKRIIDIRLCSCGYQFAPALIIIRLKSETMKFLNVAEKNDAAKNIALHLSRGTSRRREGLSQYNKIYEFEADVNGGRVQMVMTSVSGHLLALDFVGNYKSWQTTNPLALFEAPVFKYCPENYDKIKKTLEREVRSCQGLIIWTDCDREGENIGFEIIQVCTAIKSNLQVYRAKFSEITAVSVRRALTNLEQPNKHVSDAVDVRQELDLRIGAAFTRFQTLRLQRVFPSKLADSLISYGSCQFPTLGFVVERYRAVEAFVAEPFWKIKVNHTMNDLSVDFAWERIRLFDREACQLIHDICVESPLARVVDVKTKPKSKWRPLPLDTVELEKLASRKLKINAKETMRLAEKLYTQGYISYPRTETNEYPKEMDLAQLVGLHTGDRRWGAFAQGILDGGGPRPRQGSKSDKAHPPIHPTKYADNLSGNEQRLYEFIVRSFLACCSKDAQGQETTVSIEVANERFHASGLMITARNYLDVYPYDKWSSKEIHVYQADQTFTPTGIDIVDGSTAPPNLLTEADLIGLMEKHGIGTDATHAEHIETIKSRSYVALADAVHFVPGLLGMGLVEGYDAMGLTISKPHLRAHLEADLKAISEGRKQPHHVLAEQVARYKEVYLTITAEANKIDAALAERFAETPRDYTPSVENMPVNMPAALKCPKCGSDMVVRTKKNNADELFISCDSYPSCKNAVWFPNLVKTLQVLPDSCLSCGPNYKMLKFEWRNNSISHLYPPPYTGCIGGCDTAFLDVLQIHLASVRNVPSSSSRTIVQPRANTNSAVVRPITPQNNTQSFRSNNANAGPNLRPNMPSNGPNMPNPRPNVPTNRPRDFMPPPQARPQNGPRTPLPGNDDDNNRPRDFMPPPQARPQNGPRTPLPGNDDDNNVTCSCNKPCILLTVRKQTANCGKKFYKCALGKENGGCDFFLWAPESMNSDTNSEPPQSNTSNPFTPASSWGNQGGNNQGVRPDSQGSSRGWGIAPPRDNFPSNDDDVNCNCGTPAKKLKVHKEGQNKGREFYSCPKDFSSRCSFFQWADGGSGAGAGGAASSHSDWGGGGDSGNYRGRGGRGGARGRGRGRGRGAAPRGDGEGRQRRCGQCRQLGHTRARCPNRDGDGD